MRFSLIVPVYNTETYLRACITSVLAQSFQDFELLLLNDGSTDDSPNICNCYAQQYPNQISVYHKENEGQLSTRKLGLQLAKGDFVIFLDSDDIVAPHLLEYAEKAVQAHSNADFFCYDFDLFDDTKKDKQTCRLFEERCELETHCLTKQEVYHKIVTSYLFNSICFKIIKRTLALLCDDTSLPCVKFGEDILQQLALVTAANEIVYLPEVLYHYRTHPTAITKRYRAQYYIDMCVVYTQIEHYILHVWNIVPELGFLYALELSMIRDDIVQFLDYAPSFCFFDAIRKFRLIGTDRFFKTAYKNAYGEKPMTSHLLARCRLGLIVLFGYKKLVLSHQNSK